MEFPIDSVQQRSTVYIKVLEGITDSFWYETYFSTTFHPQTDGRSERVIQFLEDMLWGCVLDFLGSWDRIFHSWYLPITTIISPVLVWPRMKPCMEEDVELLHVG